MWKQIRHQQLLETVFFSDYESATWAGPDLNPIGKKRKQKQTLNTEFTREFHLVLVCIVHAYAI